MPEFHLKKVKCSQPGQALLVVDKHYPEDPIGVTEWEYVSLQMPEDFIDWIISLKEPKEKKNK